MKTNPFFELYVGDRISSREFVTIFSPTLVPHISALFQPGNIVVKGVQGCGKSMLLRLLKPDVRREYWDAGIEFPVPLQQRKFICSSVNLAHSNVIDFGYRRHEEIDTLSIEFLFADFLNYILVERLLKSLQAYVKGPDQLRNEVGIRIDEVGLDNLAEKIAGLPVWEGWIGEISSFSELIERLQSRVFHYRRFLHGKDRKLDPEIFDTATAVGKPIASVSRLLCDAEYIDDDTNIFVDIDQYEELANISSSTADHSGEGVDYRAVINKALSARSPDVSYRIGTRGHSWGRNIRVHGTEGRLEAMRDFKFVDLDALLMKDEFDSARAKNTFSEFAEDVFRRRLSFARFSVPDRESFNAIGAVYGEDLTSEEKVNGYYGLKDPERYIRVEAEWRASTKTRLRTLAKNNLFNAKLGEIWVRQKGDATELSMRDELLPWNQKSKRWWRKERSQALAMQIASQSHQKMVWGGAREIVELAGGSILAFLGINQFIWSSWLQRNEALAFSESQLPRIEMSIQSVGIQKASNSWLEMILEQTGNSAERARFVRSVADTLRQKMLSDRALSYPGANGFSLTDAELAEHPGIAIFLEDLSDYGNMLMLRHTTKSKDRKARKKFYFHPIFAPYFGLPYVRTKEPYYAKISEVAKWIHGAGADVVVGSGEPTQDRLL